MAGRWSVWNDETVRELARHCVPAADEVWRLQRGDDPEARFFQAFADHAHYRKEGQTRQGIYVVAPDGTLLSSVNSLDPTVVRQTLRDGLAAWEALPASDRQPADTERFDARSRWEDAYPESGVVLRVTIRDLPDAEGDPRIARYNHDHVWIDGAELARALPDTLERGARIEWPELARRLAQFHLVDNALGQTLPYAPEEILEAWLTLTVEELGEGFAELGLVGISLTEADGVWRLGDNDWKPARPWPRSMRVRLLGQARFDTERRAFVRFEMVGVGEWTGRTEFNGRDERRRGRIGYLFELAGDAAAERVAPAFVDIYEGG